MRIDTGGKLDVGEIDAHVPRPRSERGVWGAVLALGTLGFAVLVLALSGVLDSSSPAPSPPAVFAVTPTPTPTQTPTGSGLVGASTAAGTASAAGHAAIVGDPSTLQVQRDIAVYLDPIQTHISERWIAGFYPIYAAAQRAFGVNWLLIASIHRQESAFSTAPGIYSGLNFAGCCGGPMQFNVTNGSARGAGSTWSLVSDSYRYGMRPAVYDHMTAEHPSIYDDFDAIMAAAHLLSSDGAGYALDGSAWDAAYDYYGHDLTGVTYADQVLARAIAWSQHDFCVNCGVPAAMVEAVHAAYGAPVAAGLEAQGPPSVVRQATGKVAAARAGSRSRGAAKSPPRQPVRSAHRPPGR